MQLNHLESKADYASSIFYQTKNGFENPIWAPWALKGLVKD